MCEHIATNKTLFNFMCKKTLCWKLVHLQKCINVPNSRDVFWYKWLQLAFKLRALWSVATDVLEEFLDLTGYNKVFEFCWVIGTVEGGGGGKGSDGEIEYLSH